MNHARREREAPTEAQTFSRLDVGMLIVLVAMAIAGVVMIGVLAADSNAEAVGVATLVVLSALWLAALAASRVERAPES